MDRDLKVKPKTKPWYTIQAIPFYTQNNRQRFYDKDTKSNFNKIDKQGLIQLKSLCTAKETESDHLHN